MEWVEPEYSRRRVNEAWAIYREIEESEAWGFGERDAYEDALAIVNNWRQSHSYPLNAVQVNLRHNSRVVDPRGLVAQRLKRFTSIESKLFRFPNMRLSQMQDIGGCRAVVDSLTEVRLLHERYISSRSNHKLSTTDDYVANPKDDGYRGIHLVYKYQSNDFLRRVYNDLKIEVQLRSRFQHAWATAVEVVGTLVNQVLKSDEGDDEWLRFFALMGAVIAIREKAPRVPRTPDDLGELIRELDDYEHRLGVIRRLRDYREGIKATEDAAYGATFFIMASNFKTNELTVQGYTRQQLGLALNDLKEFEETNRSSVNYDVVLVSVASLAELRRAYPNYYADTNLFLRLLRGYLDPYRARRNA